MTAPIVEMTKAMVELLNAGNYPTPFLAKRVAFPDFETEDPQLRVSVFAGPRTTENAARSEVDKITYTIFVAVQAKTTDIKDIDDMLEVVARIEKEVRTVGSLSGRPYVGFSDLDAGKEPYSLDTMERTAVFHTVTGFDYLDYA